MLNRLSGAVELLKETSRHVLRRPVVGVAIVANTTDGRWLLIRRGDTGKWALPGGTLEWGENLRVAAERELMEEAGVRVLRMGELSGVYSDPSRDFRFHAVTVVVRAEVSQPEQPPHNPLEIRDVGLFSADSLPPDLSLTMGDMLKNAVEGKLTWE